MSKEDMVLSLNANELLARQASKLVAAIHATVTLGVNGDVGYLFGMANVIADIIDGGDSWADLGNAINATVLWYRKTHPSGGRFTILETELVFRRHLTPALRAILLGPAK